MDRKCEVCGNNFTTDRMNKKYCSPACAQKAKDLYAAEYRKRMLRPTRMCRGCGKEFISSCRGQRYCTTDCKLKYRTCSEQEVCRKRRNKNSLDSTLKEIEQYNKLHNTHLTYGKYISLKFLNKL